ncbi:hypothetical protein [Aquabacterium sp. J223]|uniref:hypothetical protein n=1 Tax=Aquabacterium sp. J223 TaxID=2898431 RepID=UPI0021AE2EEC|nr:hypothetical protein [Aquabacterium sp. J223]UUX95967.1 hypothetical protein LRS07_01055 [Aquabacterium sp. J223]
MDHHHTLTHQLLQRAVEQALVLEGLDLALFEVEVAQTEPLFDPTIVIRRLGAQERLYVGGAQWRHDLRQDIASGCFRAPLDGEPSQGSGRAARPSAGGWRRLPQLLLRRRGVSAGLA